MAVAEHFTETHLNGTINARMILNIANYIIAAPGNRADDAEISLKSRAEHDSILFTGKRGQFAFKLNMQVKIAV